MRQTVFHYICDHGPCTSRDIAEGLRLHPIGRVTVQIKNLAHKQFIRSPGFEPRDPDHKHRMRLWEATKPRDARIPMDPPPNTLKRRDHQARLGLVPQVSVRPGGEGVMAIETLEDIVEELADRCGIYGACKDPAFHGCPSDNVYCCRPAFVSDLRQRIVAAVEVEQKLSRETTNG